MSDDTADGTDATSAVPARSAPEVDDAIDRAAADSEGGGTLRPPEQSHPGTAPVEQVRDDGAMTEGTDDDNGDG